MYQIGYDLCVPELLTYISLWVGLYSVLRSHNPARTPEWHCRTVTVVHALLISVLATYGAIWGGPWPFTHAGGPNNWFQVRTTSICLAYFIFDFCWCLYFQTEGGAGLEAVMMVHHCLSILGLSVCLIAGKYGTEMLATIAGAEVTNPLLQLRWFLRATGRHHTLFADLVEWVFMLSFGVVRLGVGTTLLYCYYQQDTDWFGRGGATGLYVISVLFFINIVSYAFRKYTKRYRQWAERGTQKKDDDAVAAAAAVSQNGHITQQNGHVPEPNGHINEQEDEEGEKSKIDVSEVGVVKEQEIPSQRDIKRSVSGELVVRRNCMVAQQTADCCHDP